MSTETTQHPKPIRLVFELARDDHPRLYDDLIRFHKGTKRVNRLRVLAYDGLLAQGGAFAGIGHGLPHQPSENSAQEGSGDVTNDIFAPAIDG
ncbi:hypothetical protein [Thauera sp.]|uniref:hypothetical protein n=1 Tax=Thauera sp. TaxID=1905334 RepID=UPI001B710511|nr:hypothetical protein [Thauera sp.]MBP7048345.1 hypothetical protein [Thauera sp.]